MTDCRICGNNENNRTYLARELHLGLGDEFEYFECARCGCLQIKEIPEDLRKYNPSEYYSYRPAAATVEYSKNGLGGYKQRFVARRLARHYFEKKTFFG